MTHSETLGRTAPGKARREPSAQDAARPRIGVLIPRGEAIRNFVYSRAVRDLNRRASVFLLSVTQDESTIGAFKDDVDEVLPLVSEPYHPALDGLINFIDLAHYRVMGTVVAKEVWIRRHEQKLSGMARVGRMAMNAATMPFSNRPAVQALTRCSQVMASYGPATKPFLDLFRKMRPAIVFNGSHIHSPASWRPLAAARRLGIPTAAFIFSWDNITSRGRIKEPYDYYFVWHQGMKDELLKYYPNVKASRVFVTGTPQMDFHFKPEFVVSRAEICRRVGLDPSRPFIFYTTGVAGHFPEEHRTVEFIANALKRMQPSPQLLVRTYIKGTSEEMKALAGRNLPGVVFPPVLWKEDALTPMYEDITVYSSLLHHCSLGINVASTVSLELMIHDKPVINLGFDPPGSNLTRWSQFERHLRLDHYRPVAESGGVMVARSTEDLERMIQEALTHPGAQSAARRRFIDQTFGNTLDGKSAQRIADVLISLAGDHKV